MLNIKYSNQAEIDLQDAISYIADESITIAINYLSGYEAKIELLHNNPYMGFSCKNKFIRRDCRIIIYKSHIIIYRVDRDKNEIFIIRIYHGSVDYIKSLNEKGNFE